MCIAVYKPQGAKMPSNKTLQTCFLKNDDGAGFMFPVNGKVHIEKGFMTFNAFKKGLKNALKNYGLGKTETPIVMHFRIGTQGPNNKQLTHPYPLSNDYNEMKKLKLDTNFGIVHNGIISLTSDYRVSDHNDTMEYIKEIVYPLVNNDKNYYKNKGILDVMKYTLDGNRFLIMDGDGHVELLGGWEQDKGVYYSNTGYRSFSYKTTNLLGSDWYRLGYDDYDFEAWGYGKDIDKSTTSKKDKSAKTTPLNEPYFELSAQQVSDIYNKGEMFCESCGGEIYYGYDDVLDKYIAICLDCGEMFIIDDETARMMIETGLIIEREYYDDDKYYENLELAYGGTK